MPATQTMPILDEDVLAALLAQHAPLRPVPLVPSLRAFFADDELPLWQALEEAAGVRVSAPFFAVAWPGAQALARAIHDGAGSGGVDGGIDGGVDVAGRRVVDLGCGSGLAAVAAAVAGAAHVVAVDNDPLALAAVRVLARAHDVDVDTRVGDVTDSALIAELEGSADVILAGDVVYNAVVGQAVVAAVRRWRTAGRTVIVADSGRPFFDADDLVEFAAFDVDVARAVEGVDRRRVRLYR